MVMSFGVQNSRRFGLFFFFWGGTHGIGCVQQVAPAERRTGAAADSTTSTDTVGVFVPRRAALLQVSVRPASAAAAVPASATACKPTQPIATFAICNRYLINNIIKTVVLFNIERKMILSWTNFEQVSMDRHSPTWLALVHVLLATLKTKNQANQKGWPTTIEMADDSPWNGSGQPSGATSRQHTSAA